MTTIACDGKTLASDSQGTSSYIHQGKIDKIIDAGDGFYAFTGDLYDLQPLLDAAETYFGSVTFKQDGTPNAPMAYSFGDLVIESALVYMPLDSDFYTIFSSDKNGMLRTYQGNYPAAFGSGSDFAMGAMVSGSGAEEAVKAAIALDPYSGGDINSYSVESDQESEQSEESGA